MLSDALTAHFDTLILDEDGVYDPASFNDRLLLGLKGTMSEAQGEKTLAEPAQQFDVHPHQITGWKTPLLDGAAGVFGSGAASTEARPAVDLKVLHAKIGELALENDFLAGALEPRPACWAQSDD